MWTSVSLNLSPSTSELSLLILQYLLMTSIRICYYTVHYNILISLMSVSIDIICYSSVENTSPSTPSLIYFKNITDLSIVVYIIHQILLWSFLSLCLRCSDLCIEVLLKLVLEPFWQSLSIIFCHKYIFWKHLLLFLT